MTILQFQLWLQINTTLSVEINFGDIGKELRKSDYAKWWGIVAEVTEKYEKSIIYIRKASNRCFCSFLVSSPLFLFFQKPSVQPAVGNDSVIDGESEHADRLVRKGNQMPRRVCVILFFWGFEDFMSIGYWLGVGIHVHKTSTPSSGKHKKCSFHNFKNVAKMILEPLFSESLRTVLCTSVLKKEVFSAIWLLSFFPVFLLI